MIYYFFIILWTVTLRVIETEKVQHLRDLIDAQRHLLARFEFRTYLPKRSDGD